MTAASLGAPLQRRKKKRPFEPGRAISTLLMVVSGLVTALPIYLLVDDGLRTQGEIVRSPLSLTTRMPGGTCSLRFSVVARST